MKKHILQFSLFGIAKSAVLFAPLIAASILLPDQYGLLEWALSFAMMLGLLASFGSGGLISFEIIKHETSTLSNTALLYSAITTFIFGILGLLSILFENYIALSYILSFSSVFVGQFALSAYIKAKGKGAYASVVESLIYILILILLIYAIFQQVQTLSLLSVFPLTAMLLSFILFTLISDSISFKPEDLTVFAKKGFPIMLSGFLAVGFVNLPRVLLGHFESLESVAAFSLYFRWAAIALVAYQFALVVNFRKIYTYSYEKLDRYIVSISLMVFVLGACIIFGINIIENQNISLSIAFPLQNITIQTLMAGTITLWAIGTSLEGLFYREHLSRLQTYASLSGIGIFLINILILKFFIHDIIFIFTLSWFISYSTIIFVQLYFLKKYLDITFNRIFYFLLIFIFSLSFCLTFLRMAYT